MNPWIRRFVGISFIIFALMGIIISIMGIYGTWQVRSNLMIKLFETTEIVNSTLSTTYNGMNVLSDTLDEAIETIESSERVMFAMAQTIGDIDNLTSGFLGMIGSRIPGLQQPGDSTERENPMSNFAVVETEMENIARNFSQVNSAMKDAQDVVGSYQDVIKTTQGQIQDFQENGPKWITTTTWVLTILLIWFAITQVGFIIQGMEFINSTQEKKVENIDMPTDN